MSEMLHIKHSGMEGSSLPLIGMYPLSVSLPFLPPLCCVLSHFSRVQLFVIPWTVACQAPLSMGFSRQEYWSGLPFLSPRGLPNPGMEPESPALTGRFFTTEPPGKPECGHRTWEISPSHWFWDCTERRQGMAWGAGSVSLDELSKKSSSQMGENHPHDHIKDHQHYCPPLE